MAVAGDLSYCFLAEFDSGDVIIGCESELCAEAAAEALDMHDFSTSNVLCRSSHGQWRIVTWRPTSASPLKAFTVCAASRRGGAGWVGAVCVGADIVLPHAAPSPALHIVAASAVACRKAASFDCCAGCETCDIQCLWTPPSSSFFPGVDVYLLLERLDQPDALIWQGRSASGMFIIHDAPLSVPMHIVLMVSTSLLQRATLARVPVSGSFTESDGE
jgi:hypothetical protein